MSDDAQQSPYEKTDVHMPTIVSWSVGCIVLLVICVIALNELFWVTESQIKMERIRTIREPAAKVTLRQEEARVLKGDEAYKLLDAETERYQIPVDRAIKLISEESAETPRSRFEADPE